MGINVRKLIIRDYEKKFKNVTACVLVDHSKYTAEETKRFRRLLRQTGLEMHVVRNRLARLAFESLGNKLIGTGLAGPVSIIHGEDCVTVSRAVADWNRTNRPIPIKGGYIEGSESLLTPGDVQSLARLPDKDTMRANLIWTFVAPIRNIANCFHASLAAFANCVNAHIEKLDGEAGAQAPEADSTPAS